jgi:cytochrome c-type biogenesis protein CcmH
MRPLALVWAVALLLAGAGTAAASEERPTLAELEKELVCPTCSTTLDMSDAPGAQRMKAYIRERIDEGATKTEIKDELVAQFGEGVLAAPPRRGFDLLAWLLPVLGLALGGAAVGLAAWHWSRRRGGDEPEHSDEAAAAAVNGRLELDPELERRLDEELARFGG